MKVFGRAAESSMARLGKQGLTYLLVIHSVVHDVSLRTC